MIKMKRILRDRNIKIEELALKTGINKYVLAEICAGNISIRLIEKESVQKIADALRCYPSDLLDEEDEEDDDFFSRCIIYTPKNQERIRKKIEEEAYIVDKNLLNYIEVLELMIQEYLSILRINQLREDGEMIRKEYLMKYIEAIVEATKCQENTRDYKLRKAEIEFNNEKQYSENVMDIEEYELG